MAAYRIPGILCVTTAEPIDTGTLCLSRSPVCGPVGGHFSGQQSYIPAQQSLLRNWYSMTFKDGVSANILTISPDAATLLTGVEELRLKPYDDQTGKEISGWVAGATIGYGHLIKSGAWNGFKDGMTKAQADALFNTDLEPYQNAVREAINAGLQQYQYDALVIFCFNIGAPAFKGSSVAKLVNDPKAITSFATLEAAWKAWNTSQGQVMKGLDNRRNCEWKIYSKGVYERW